MLRKNANAELLALESGSQTKSIHFEIFWKRACEGSSEFSSLPYSSPALTEGFSPYCALKNSEKTGTFRNELSRFMSQIFATKRVQTEKKTSYFWGPDRGNVSDFSFFKG